MNNNKKETKKKFRVIDIFRNKQYYAIANLAFYGILIIILIVFARTSNPGSNQNFNNNFNIEGFENIKEKNFSFKYTLTVDNNTNVFEGKQNKNESLFVDSSNGKSFYLKDNMFLTLESDNYILTNSPVKYFNYFNIDLVSEILSKAVIDENDWVVSIADFSSILGNNIDGVDEDIFINVHKQNSVVTKLSFDLSPYASIIDERKENVLLVLEYSDFNLIDDFDIVKNS